MPSISVTNISKATSPFWSKVSAACSFVSASILGMGISSDNMTILWFAFGLQIIAGVVVIFTNGTPKPFSRTPAVEVTTVEK